MNRRAGPFVVETDMGDTATRYIGNCQICEGDFKLVPSDIRRVDVDGQMIEQPMSGKVVHHGYKRPGYGYIVGDCPGVHEAPYETSCDLIKAAIVGVKASLAGLNETLAKLQRDDVIKITVLDLGGRNHKTYVRAETEEYKWKDLVRGEIGKVKYDITLAERELRRFEERVRAWKPAWIRSIEEERAKKDVARTVREAARAASAKAKADKRAAIDAKNKAFEEKKAQLVVEAIEKLRALATGPDPAKQKWKAWEIMSRLHKKVGWKYYEPKEWKIDRDLIALGVARDAGTYVQYDSV